MARKHDASAPLANRIERIVHGRDATQLLDEGVDPHAHVILLPVWSWAFSRMDLGRKDRDADGNSLLMPVRLSWEPGSVQAVTEEGRIRVTAMSLGYDESRIVTVHPEHGARIGDNDISLPEEIPVHATTRAEYVLEQISEDGRVAYFELLDIFRDKLRWMLDRAHSSLSIELFDDRVMRILDSQSLDHLADTMVLGDEGGGSTRATRLVESCTDPTRFRTVDPTRYVNQALRRDAGEGLRSALGDPRMGTKIRAVARDIESSDPAEITSAYRKRYPRESVAIGRVMQAMSMFNIASYRAQPSDPSTVLGKAVSH